MAAPGGTAPGGRASIQAVNHSARLCRPGKHRTQKAKDILKCLCHKGGQRERDGCSVQEGGAEHPEQQAGPDILLAPHQAEANPDVTPSSAPVLRGRGEHLEAERAGKVTLNPGDSQHREARAAEKSEWTGAIPKADQAGARFIFAAGHRLT